MSDPVLSDLIVVEPSIRAPRTEILSLSENLSVVLYQREGAPGIYAQYFNALGNAIGGPIQIDSTWTGEYRAAPLGNGTFVMTWSNKAQIFDSAGSPVGDDLGRTGHIVVLDDGSFIIVSNTGAQRFTQTGAPIGDEVVLPGGAGSSVTQLSTGELVVSWVESFELHVQRVTTTGTLVGSEIVTELGNEQDGIRPTRTWVYALDDGEFVVTFSGQEWLAGGPDIHDVVRLYGQGFNADGTPEADPYILKSLSEPFEGWRGSADILGWEDGTYLLIGAGHDGMTIHNQLVGSIVQPDGTRTIVFYEDNQDVTANAHTNVSATILPDGRIAIAYGMEEPLQIGIFDPRGASLTGTADGELIVGADFGAYADNTIFAGAGDDEVYGLGGADILHGEGDNDILDGGIGADRTFGGAGNDTHFVDNASDLVFEEVAEGSDTVYASLSYVLRGGAEVEFLRARGSTLTTALNLTGNEFGQTLIGNAGANALDGRGGADSLRGLVGDDTYFVDNAGDVVLELVGEGSDTVYTTLSYALRSGAEVEFLRARGSTETTPLDLTGNEFGQMLVGNAGANVLDGRGDDDQLRGLDGDDTYFVDSAGDIVVEAASDGSDTVYSSAVSYVLHFGSEVEFLRVRGSTETTPRNLTGNQFDQMLVGNAGANTLDGGAGDDVLRGLEGNDAYIVDTPDEIVVEAAGAGEGADAIYAKSNYVLRAGVAVETLRAIDVTAATAINLTGNEFAQTLLGNAGANILNGGDGADTLRGYAGSDTFVFNEGEANGDFLIDFAGNGAAAGDRLQFVGYGPGATFAKIDATHGEITYDNGASTEIITFTNSAAVHASDVFFV